LGGPQRIPCASAKPGLSYKETLKEPQIHQMATPEYGKTHGKLETGTDKVT